MNKIFDFMDNEVYEKIIKDNKDYVLKFMKKNNINKEYEIAIVLGSGLSGVLNDMKVDFEIPYSSLPYLPTSKIPGHESKLIFGSTQNKNIIIMSGRIHLYEGFYSREITLGIRVLKSIGVKNIIFTNAAGGINEKFETGDIMIIKDHINFSGINPLIGENLNEFGERFPSLASAWDKSWSQRLKKDLDNTNIQIKSGVYLYSTGPSYETPAEIKMFKMFGADALGMSTVFEAIVAVHSQMKVLGLSIITNKCDAEKSPSHKEVLINAKLAKQSLKEILNIAIKEA